MDEKKTTNEVNLIDILAAIWKWIVSAVKFIINVIGKVLQLLFRHKVLTLILLAACFAISQYFSRPSNRRYNVEGMAVLHGVQAKTIKQIGSQLSTSSSRFEVTSLGHKLGLRDSVAKKLGGVQFFDVIDYKKDSVPDVVDFNRNHSLTDTVNVVMPNYIYVRLIMAGTNHVDEAGEAVLNFLNNNPIVQSEFETQKNIYEQQIALTDLEAKRLDSLALIKYFENEKPNIKFQNNQLLIGNQNIQLFYGDRLYLQRIRSEAQTRLSEAKAPIIIPSGFIINPKAVNGRMKNGMKGLIVGFALSLLIAFFLENYKKWIHFLNRK